jgi:PA domain
MGLAVLAGGLAFVGSAEATELISDGSFENTVASSNPIVKVGGKANPGLGEGWSTFSTYLYSTLYTMPGPANCGLQFLRPYPAGTAGIAQSSAVVTQLVGLTNATTLTPVKIDAGQGRYTMSAWFSSYLTQGDYSDLTLQFLDATTNAVGSPIALGGQDFVANIPTEQNAKYPDAKDWAQDVRTGTVPSGARAAQVKIASTALSGSPDGYVDLVSLDVVDTGLAIPSLSAADPPNNAVGVGPVVTVAVTLQDRATAVNTNSIQLLLDNASVTPVIQKTGTNTVVSYAAGLLPALSEHTYQIAFGDTGTPSTVQTNQFKFTVANYLTLPAALKTPLGSEDTTKPGFNVSVYQVDALVPGDTPPAQVNLPSSIAFSESVLAGLAGPNVADVSKAAAGDSFVEPGVINWVNSTGATANFPNDLPFPGIPGTTGTEDNFVDEIVTYVRFPGAGYYQMGINNQDAFRLNAATAGIQTLRLTAPTNMVIPCVPIATNIVQLQFGGSLPLTPLTAPVVYATPSGQPDDACSIGTKTGLTGKIVLLDRGGTNCDSGVKAEQAQLAGAVAVIEVTPGDTGFPFRLGDVNTNVHIPVLVIAENYGGSALKSYLQKGTAVTAVIQGDPNPRIAEWDGPKGFGAVDVTAGFAVLSAGVYPLRLVAEQSTGMADLEWFSIKADGSRVLLNDTSNPDALLAFRARTGGGAASFNPPTLSAQGLTVSWTGSGTLEEADSVAGPWKASASQSNPQTVRTDQTTKFYRIRQG